MKPLAGLQLDAACETPLHGGWELAATAPGAFAHPDALAGAPLAWGPALVPGTVAESLRADLEAPRDLDAEDWWYRCAFDAPQELPGPCRLRFEGLATLAEVWLNGERILESSTMFRAHTCEVGRLLRPRNELAIRFRALKPELERRRSRPRWKTALVAHQNLRWFRTTLLGRIPGWTPLVPPVGPWRGIFLESGGLASLAKLDLQTSATGTTGRASLNAQVAHEPALQVTGAALRLNGHRFPLAAAASEGGTRLSGACVFEDAPLWSPHTHGQPNLVACALEVETDAGTLSFDCGKVGFKDLSLHRRDGEIQLVVNGLRIFCRGACWTIGDFRSLAGREADLRHALTLARDAGLNMLRVGGTMVYESEAFYRLCDELGILVWQDFMFANMDYPFTDAAFHHEAEAEAVHQLNRLQRHPCVAVYCGSSETEQQAAMLGLPKSEWSNPFFAEALPRLCAAWHKGIPYFPSTPTEGALPFHAATGLSHYYGVGAYRRPLSDTRLAGVKFTPECLGFSQVPDEETLDELFDGALPPPHHPRWKARVPRDAGAGWDFEDIRDHYLRELTGLDPVALRSQDLERYFALSRAAAGEAMKRTFAEWRRPGSGCGGALVWFLKDLWPGAGWGLLDSHGRPKSAYWHLRRAWARRAVLITDEGLDGLHLHAFNETAAGLEAILELELLQRGRPIAGKAAQPLSLTAFGAATVSGDAMLPAFADLAYAYRFGPPKHDAALVRLRHAGTGEVLSQDVHFPTGLCLPRLERVELDAKAAWTGEGEVEVLLRSDALLQEAVFHAPGFLPDDNHFHLAPGQEKRLRFRPLEAGAAAFKARFGALNLAPTTTLRAER